MAGAGSTVFAMDGELGAGGGAGRMSPGGACRSPSSVRERERDGDRKDVRAGGEEEKPCEGGVCGHNIKSMHALS